MVAHHLVHCRCANHLRPTKNLRLRVPLHLARVDPRVLNVKRDMTPFPCFRCDNQPPTQPSIIEESAHFLSWQRFVCLLAVWC